MHSVKIGKKTRPVPASWNELTRRQLLAIAKTLNASFTLDQDLLRISLLRIILSVPRLTFMQFTDVQIVNISWLADFLIKANTLTDNLLPSLKASFWRFPSAKRLNGPADDFRNIRFEEFCDADHWYLQYHQKKQDPAALDKLVATLYRPRRKDYDPTNPDFKGDIREDYNPHLVERRLRQVALLPAAQKLAVLLWYQGCRQRMERTFPLVFAGEQKKSKGKDYGWPELQMNLAEHEFPDRVPVAFQLVYAVFLKMEITLKNQEEK